MKNVFLALEKILLSVLSVNQAISYTLISVFWNVPTISFKIFKAINAKDVIILAKVNKKLIKK
jgi:hypothetical protein